MALQIYDTLSRKKKTFKPRGKIVKMFVCGPTVYDYTHIGHARSYINFDIVARYLKWKGYKLNYVQNITDIDDRIIKRANENKEIPAKLAKEFENTYYEDMRALNVLSVDKYVRASDNVKGIINQVQRLIKKGFAYQIDDGVYFDISKFKDYGKLSRQNLEQLKEHRVEPNPQKRNPGDFSLWKKHKAGEPSWPSPFGAGRPGWHIEDTTITEKLFGPQYDIHGGGIDLIFPHHECEIAQIEAVSGKKPLVNYWMHNEFLLVNGEKMSKSLGNFVTIRDALAKYSPQAMRLFFAATHYRQPINYSEENLRNTNVVYQKFVDFVLKLQNVKIKASGKVDTIISKAKKEFEAAMDDDFNIAGALAAIFDFMSEINKLIDSNKLSFAAAKKVYKQMLDFDKVLGLNLSGVKEEKLPAELMKLIKEREQARKSKYWKTSDRIRNELKAKGILLEDLQDGGTRWKKA
ncbi:MAG: cysteine--tRNA ligase [DPANN group archaeon]|nr:cysteine--tRNA ligase [DPANN group archaeon]